MSEEDRRPSMGQAKYHDGYYRFATLFEDRVYFVCEDDIWTTSIDGRKAHRLTTGQGESSLPRISPDGRQIAYVGREEGHPEVFVVDAEGGPSRRLTYVGSDLLNMVGWSKDGQHIYFISDHHAPFYRASDAFAISHGGGSPTCFKWGHVQSFDIASDGRVLIGRNNSDPARWKRYRGGTRGDIWIDRNGDGKFNRLLDLNSNLVWPMWINDRVYFLSDHEGIGNIYSCNDEGADMKRHTNQTDYFVRFPSTDGERISYTAGGDVFILDPETGEDRKLEFQAPASTHQIQRKFVQKKEYIEHFSPHPEGHSLALIMRGQPLTLGNWEGPVLQHGVGSAVRYRHCEWMPDGKEFVVVNDKDGFERVEIHKADQSGEPQFITEEDLGRVIDLKVSPDGKFLALSNHRHELWQVEVKTKNVKLLDKSPAERISDFNWSPDSSWIAYSWASEGSLFIIRIVNIESGEINDVTDPIRYDVCPSWDPEGAFLYFLGARDFYPVMDAMSFDYGFPRGVRPYLVTLRKDVASPFVKKPKPVVARKGGAARPASEPGEEEESGGKGKKKSNKEAKKLYKKALTEAYRELVKEVESSKASARKSAGEDKKERISIDFEGISSRILAIPVGEGRYGQIVGVKGRVLFSLYPLRGIRPDQSWIDDNQITASVIAYDFEEGKQAVLFNEVNEMRLAFDNQTLFYSSKRRVRAVDALEKLPSGSPSNPSGSSRSSGFVDLSRVQVLVNPQDEWTQMYDEAWRLQKEQFWDEKMSDIDWDLVYDRYSRLLPRLRTRSEVSDLIWEMQGELGTSHAYEIGGDYRRAPSYRQGYLGADLSYDSRTKAYKIEKIYQGDSWQERSSSPLSKPGIGIENGDLILAVNGQAVSKDLTVNELLLNQAGKEVNLTIKSKGKKEKRQVTVETLRHERSLRYRDWVEANRKYVHEQSGGKVGYVHIPDMGPKGFAEFHRGYLAEVHREGLVVDVRYNGGGHVSSLLLQKLARRRVGYDVSRWGPAQPYPQESVAGPMVAVTNEFAGSDGDIFSHCFKLFELGPLVGKRTWGGVIGIWPRHRLVDGTITTQPEYSFWFVDVGYGVENYGTDPDVEVDIAPHEFHKGHDPQMDKALSIILQSVKSKPFKLPDFSERPQLTLPVSGIPVNGKNGGSSPGRSRAKSGAKKPSAKPKKQSQKGSTTKSSSRSRKSGDGAGSKSAGKSSNAGGTVRKRKSRKQAGK